MSKTLFFFKNTLKSCFSANILQPFGTLLLAYCTSYEEAIELKKHPTIYTKNYTVLLNERNVGRKYAILSTLLQTSNVQSVTIYTLHPTLPI